MHISYLPWNRGANPNFWSFIDDTPKGVTIHYLTEELDKGDILFQKQMFFDVTKETFASTYEKLHETIIQLLMDNWNDLSEGNIVGKKQQGKGSYHSIADFRRVSELLEFEWSDTIADVLKKYRRLKENETFIYQS